MIADEIQSNGATSAVLGFKCPLDNSCFDLTLRQIIGRVIFDRVPLVTTVLQQSHYVPLVHLATIEMETSVLTVMSLTLPRKQL